MMCRLKEFVYQYSDYAFIRVSLARWQRILSLEQAEPAFRNQIIKIIYAYVEMLESKPVYCHRIEAVRYAFDEDGYYCPPPLPDLGLLSGVGEEKITYLSSKREQQQFFTERYWELSPQLLDTILDKIWDEYR
jgi:hypothetical protein